MRSPILRFLPFALLVVGVRAVAAQEPATPTMSGQVLRSGEGFSPAMVVLHSVSAEASGEVDSTRVTPEGRFGFILPTAPDPGARHDVYFASVRHHGVLYFGAPVSQVSQLDSLYTIEVFDTTVVPAGGQTFPVQLRNIFLEQASDGWTVTDLIQIRNDGDRTYVAADSSIVWSHPLPPDARELSLGQTDLPPETVELTGGTLRLSAPMPPGERLLVVRYVLPEGDLEIPVLDTERMDLLVREPAPPLAIPLLEAAQPVELEAGSSYRRFVGVDLEDGVVSVSIEEPPFEMSVEWMSVILALLLGVAGVTVYVRAPGGVGVGASGLAAVGGHPGGGAPAREGRHSMLTQIAALDDAFEATSEMSPDARAENRRLREALKARLATLSS